MAIHMITMANHNVLREQNNSIHRPAPNRPTPVIKRRTDNIDHLRSEIRLSARCPAPTNKIKNIDKYQSYD